jgi:dipeptidyl aminopeptidase/acylaminoacyl peptidase
MPNPITNYIRIVKAYFPAISYDARRLAFISDTAGLPQVFELIMSGDLSAPTWRNQITRGDNRVLGCWFSPASGDDRMIFAQDEGGDENAQLYLIPSQKDEILPLTKGFGRAMHVFGDWSSDGRHILFASNRRHPGLFDLYLQTIGGETRMVWQNEIPGFLPSINFSPDERSAAVVHMASSFNHNLLEIDLVNEGATLLSPPDEAARYLSARYSADGKSLFLNTDLDSDFLYIANLDLETFAFEPIIEAEWDIETMTLSPKRDRLAYTVNMEGASQLKVYDINTGETFTAPLPDAAPGVVAKWDLRMIFSPHSRHVIFSFTSSIRTSNIFTWNIDSNVVTEITRSSHGNVARDSFVVPELIHFTSFDQRPIPAWFYKPREKGAGLAPAIVFVHGGPESQFTPFFHFMVQYFLAHGYAVLAPNVRGSTGYGKAYSHLDDVEKRMDAVADLAHAANWLRERPDIDGDKIVVYGGSYGGFMVLAAMTHYPDLWAAGVDIIGISNFVTFLENTSLYRRFHREAEYGSPEKDREFLENISPINHIDKLSAPLMVIHGANDPRVPLSEAEQLVDSLKARDIPVEFIVLEDEGHGIVKFTNKKIVYPAIVEFLEKHLGS